MIIFTFAPPKRHPDEGYVLQMRIDARGKNKTKLFVQQRYGGPDGTFDAWSTFMEGPFYHYIHALEQVVFNSGRWDLIATEVPM